jgi:hypothetical protein
MNQTGDFYMTGRGLILTGLMVSSSAFAGTFSPPMTPPIPLPIPTISSVAPTSGPSPSPTGIVGGLPIITTTPIPTPGNGPLQIIDQIVNEGTKIWQIIQQNKATSSFTTASANAIPSTLTAWDQIGGWQMKGGENYQLPILNSEGKSVYTWDARVSFEYGGNVDGKGAFLRNVTVQASDIQVAWAHNFNATVTIPDSGISNSGTTDNPLAQMEVEIDYSYDTSVFVHRQSSVILVVRGDGSIEDISSDNSSPTPLYPIGKGN